MVGSRKRAAAIERHAAPGENARHDVGHAMVLRDGQRDVFLALVEPVMPGKAVGRLPDIEKLAPLIAHDSFRFKERRPYPKPAAKPKERGADFGSVLCR